MDDKTWDKFLEWLYKSHQITKDWIPNKVSIELWLEYKNQQILTSQGGRRLK